MRGVKKNGLYVLMDIEPLGRKLLLRKGGSLEHKCGIYGWAYQPKGASRTEEETPASGEHNSGSRSLCRLCGWE